MTAAKTSVPITRENTAEGIRQCLTYLEEVGIPLDGWQSDMFARAIAHLRIGSYALAAEESFCGCRPDVYRPQAVFIEFIGAPTVTIAELWAELDLVLGDDNSSGVRR